MHETNEIVRDIEILSLQTVGRGSLLMPFSHVAFKGMLGAGTGATDGARVHKLLSEVFLLNVVHQFVTTPVSATTQSAFQL